MVEAYEKMGALYLGRRFDAKTHETTPETLLYDARDLTTHAVIIGMTGSGKTGLGVTLIEEAAIDGVPVIAIDPKGDITNLALTFPELKPADFRPWVNVEEAAREGVGVDELAGRTASRWREGIAEWGQDGARIQRLRDAADVAIYTPGSSAGLGVSLLASFRAPPEAVRADGDLLRDRVDATVESLLALIGIEADPLEDRRHILLANLLHHAWTAGRDLDLAGLLAQIEAPPFERLGVMAVDRFFPKRDRRALAMRLNALLAAPGFSSWMTGEPLEIPRFLRTAEGRPRVSVFAIHHLDDAARMSFVTLLLSEILAWARTQPGTTSLRAILYMDEVFGYFPPVANPPAKKPLLTLLKQARAYGLGVVLATQNPVDLDYKGLSNTGTWFIGRLQTDRDKLRVLEALDGASADSDGPSRKELDRMLSGLGKRVFLLHNVHESSPALFHTRWALSYLRGPLTREQIRTITEARPDAVLRDESVGAELVSAPLPPGLLSGVSPSEQVSAPEGTPTQTERLGDAIRQIYAPVRTPPLPATSLIWGAVALSVVRMRYARKRFDIDTVRDWTLAAEIADRPVPIDWASAIAVTLSANDFWDERPSDGLFGDPPAAALDAARWPKWERAVGREVRLSRPLVLWHSKDFHMTSRPGETESDLRARIAQRWREDRDREMQKLRDRYTPKIRKLRERFERAQDAMEKQWDDGRVSRRADSDVGLAIGASVVGALFGARSFGATSLRRASRALAPPTPHRRRRSSPAKARKAMERARKELSELDREFHAAADRVGGPFDAADVPLERVELRARVADVTVRLFALGWLPFWRDVHGELHPAWSETPVLNT